jgi:hypothetical protein
MARSSTREDIKKSLACLRWTPSYVLQRLTKTSSLSGPRHVMIAVADHFEPGFTDLADQHLRIQRWCEAFERIVPRAPDNDGHFFRHTYFYPAEQYHPWAMEPLLRHCQDGWGEIEIQLHHGIEKPDTSENTRAVLERFRDALAGYGCLSRERGDDRPRYAFVHGNWALANSFGNRYCGVDDEMEILRSTGCYADMTLPSAPDGPQTSKINSVYECGLPLNRQAPHRRGRDLRLGRSPNGAPIIVQGPLALYLAPRNSRWPVPRIENGEISRANPPGIARFLRWVNAGISVNGRPDWVFVKLHCHGLEPGEEPTPDSIGQFLDDLVEFSERSGDFLLHFVSAREMFNIICAACDGCQGSPGAFRDYRLKLIGESPEPQPELCESALPQVLGQPPPERPFGGILEKHGSR